MKQETSPSREPRLLFQTLFLLFNLYLLSKISAGSTTEEVRAQVLERAKGKCEGCDKKGVRLIAAHMDHTHNQNYDNAHYLKAFCLICEFRHHVSHVGREKEIGLNEADNNTTTNSLWQRILRECSKEEITDLYRRYNAPIRRVYQKFGFKMSRLKKYA